MLHYYIILLDSMEMNDFHAATFLKGVGLMYLCYVVMFKHYKIPVLFFILYGVGSLLNVLERNTSTAEIYKQSFNVAICALIILFILFK